MEQWYQFYSSQPLTHYTPKNALFLLIEIINYSIQNRTSHLQVQYNLRRLKFPEYNNKKH